MIIAYWKEITTIICNYSLVVLSIVDRGSKGVAGRDPFENYLTREKNQLKSPKVT
jgi:hypothetical protein